MSNTRSPLSGHVPLMIAPLSSTCNRRTAGRIFHAHAGREYVDVCAAHSAETRKSVARQQRRKNGPPPGLWAAQSPFTKDWPESSGLNSNLADSVRTIEARGRLNPWARNKLRTTASTRIHDWRSLAACLLGRVPHIRPRLMRFDRLVEHVKGSWSPKIAHGHNLRPASVECPRVTG